jgi:hypothetical protein
LRSSITFVILFCFVYSIEILSLTTNVKFEKGVPIKNQKGQMPPRRLFTLTRGIQIRGQPLNIFFLIFSNFLVRTLQCKKKSKKLNFCPWKHEKKAQKSCSEFIIGLFLGSFFRTADTAENLFSILEIRLRHPLFFLLCDTQYVLKIRVLKKF